MDLYPIYPWNWLFLLSRSVVSDSLRPRGLQHTRPLHPSLSPRVSFPKLMFIESVMPSNHLILCRPLLFPSIAPSIRVFSSELTLCIRWPKYWSFSFCFSPSNEYSGLISFRIDWFDLLSVQGTLKSSVAPQFKDINSLMFINSKYNHGGNIKSCRYYADIICLPLWLSW